MNTSAKLILFPQSTKQGYPLKIRIIQGRKPVYIGLKYYLTDTLKQRYWNSTKDELRKSYPKYSEVMAEFNKELNKLGIETLDNKASIEQEPIQNSESFTLFYLNYMKDLEFNNKIGLLQKIHSVLFQLNSYCESSGRSTNILFKELNIDFMNGFKNHLVKKKILPVTQRGYIEKIRSIVNRAIKQNKYNPKRHPFLGFEFDKIQINPKCINPEELDLIKSLSSNSYNYKIALKFLFQYYSFGMRVSDLLLLKWGDIKETGKRIKYTMYKTKQRMDISLNSELIDILYEFMDYDIKTEMKFIFHLPSSIKKRIQYFENYKQRNDGEEKEFKYPVNSIILKEEKIDKYSLIRQYLHFISIDKDYSDKTIFSSIGSNLDIKTTYSKVSTYTSVYNKDLKTLSDEIATSSGINLKLSSHMARHTFAYISLLSGQSVYYISKALNHKSIKTTELYLSGFEDRHLDDQFYKKELSFDDKKSIDDKLAEILISADYDKKKKILDLFNM